MSRVVDKIIADISSLSAEEQEEVFWMLAEQKRKHAEAVAESIEGPEKAAINDELTKRVDGPFLPLDTAEKRDAFWGDVHKSVNEELGYDLFEDA